jgi:hypothetical protein
MAKRGPWAAVLGVAAASLMAPTAALAVTPTSCATLQTDVNSATAGEVLQLPAGTCATNLNVINPNAFTLEGATAGGTVLTPASTSAPIVTGPSNAAVAFTLSGITFTGASGAAAVLLEAPGEAVTISGDTFTDNTYSSGFGAAVSIQTQGHSGTLATQPTLIQDSTFTGNTASTGGAVALLGGNPITLSENKFTANSGPFQAGAVAIFGESSGSTGPIVISDNTFGGSAAGAGNTTAQEGGALVLQPDQGETVTMTGNSFESNEVTGTAHYDREGGAVYIYAPSDTTGTITQSHNTFIGNLINATAGVSDLLAAGGAEFATGGTVHSTADAFVDNRVASNDSQPPWGGAVAVAASGGPVLPAAFISADDLFEGNSTAAGGWGGAIYAGAPPSTCTSGCPADTVTLDDSTIVSNSVNAGSGSEGGAIWGSPDDVLTVHNSIVFGNSPKPEIYGFAASAPTVTYSDACNEAGGPAISTGSGNICANPLLAANGAETASSPTIDVGSNALVPAGLTTDLAGQSRIRASHQTCNGLGPAIVDIGAYEFTGTLSGPTCVDKVAPHVAIGGATLRVHKGSVSVKLSCPKNQSYCKGTVTLTVTTGKGKHKRTLTLGSASFDIKGGHGKTSKIKLSGKAVSKLGRVRSVSVLAKTVAHDAAGRRGRSDRKLKLKGV